MTTWSEIVCKGRNDLTKQTLHKTERLILENIEWQVSMIAEADSINFWTANAYQEALAFAAKYPHIIYDLENDDDHTKVILMVINFSFNLPSWHIY